MTEILHKDLSYKIIGIAHEIYNSIGSGLKEKDYANAFAALLKEGKVEFKREVYYPLKMKEYIIGRNYFDFLIEGKVIIELKSGNKEYRSACKQLFEYLKISEFDLGIIIRFTSDGVRYKYPEKTDEIISVDSINSIFGCYE